MQYDPIKKSLGSVFNRHTSLRKIFYRLLDVLLLRTWYVKDRFKEIEKESDIHRILDAGSGFGQYSYRMSRVFPNAKIDGVDIKTEQINDCNEFFRELGNDKVSFSYADLTNFHIDKKYSLILSVDVMEHIDEDEKVFSKFYDLLENNGILLISTPSDKGGSDSHDHEDDNGFIDEHVRDGYSIEDISKKLKEAGFSKIEAEYSYGFCGKIAWKLSMKYPIMILGVSKLFFVLLPIYYILVYPIAAVLNWVDLKTAHTSGSGLIVKAWK